MKSLRIAVAAAAVFAAGPAAISAQTASPRVFTPTDRGQDPPAVDVWIDRLSYDYGQRIRANFASEPGAYITIMRVTTDGELRVMYPERPSRQQQYREGHTVDTRMSYTGTPTYYTYESGGTGFVFAIASFRRFDYRYYSSGDNWNVARLANSGRYGDPFEIVRMFVDRTLGGSDYTLDYVAYEVESRNVRSRYATRYSYNSFDDYYDRCLSAFGYAQSLYCGTYHNGYYGRVYYGPIIVAGPRTPIPGAPRSPNEPAVKPLVPDPMVPTSPEYGLPQRTEGRFPAKAAGEAAASARRERMLRDASPRTEMKSGSEVYVQPRRSEPQYIEHRRAEPKAEPRVYREPVMRAEPQRIEPRMSQPAPAPRAEPRVMQAAPPPRAEPRSTPRSEPSPAKAKDQQ